MKPANRTIRVKRRTKVGRLMVYPGDIITIDAKTGDFLVGIGKAESAPPQKLEQETAVSAEVAQLKEDVAPKKRGRPPGSSTLTTSKYFGGE